MHLRPYQLELIADCRAELRKHKSVCAVAPTGSGKTVMFSEIAKSAAQKGNTIWIVMHREELVWQTAEKLQAFGVRHGIIKSGYPESPAQVQVAMIQTLRNRLTRYTMPNLLIVDECHHSPSSTYQAVMQSLPATSRVLGFTATPERLDGKGLGAQYDRLVVGPTVTELVTDGYLVPARVYAPPGIDTSRLHTRMGDYVRSEAEELVDKPTITGDVIAHYQRYANGLAAVAFCVSVEHANHVAAQFNSSGIESCSVDGSMSKENRKSRLDAFRDGRIKVLTSCDLISEGFDLPRIEAAILLRPTKSLSLYLQQVGRALRPDVSNGKTCAIILDHVGNVRLHGLPEEDRGWSLEGRKARPKKDGETQAALKTCSICYVVFTGTSTCPACGNQEKQQREIKQVAGELVELKAHRESFSRKEYEQLLKAANKEDLRRICADLNIPFEDARNALIRWTKSYSELVHVERILGYTPGWAGKRYGARHGNDALQKARTAMYEGKMEETIAKNIWEDGWQRVI